MLTSLMLAAAVHSAAAVGSPQGFMEALYGRFNKGVFDYQGKEATAIFTPETAILTRKALAKETKEQDDSDDGNDFCECQDLDHPKWVITTAQQGASAATSKVLFTNNGRTITFKFWLKLTGAGWRVDDFQEVDSGWPASAHAIKTLPSFKKNQQAELKAAPAK